jgi:hypothetical protein
MVIRSKGLVATLCVLGLLGSTSAWSQSLSEAAAKEKERRKRADAARSDPSPATADGKPAPAPAPATEVHSESWWRSHARTSREAIADAEAQVKYYEARIEEARTGVRHPQPGDASPPLPPARVATDAEKREAEASLAQAQKQLAAARKQMEDLESQARREQVPPEWLR